MSESLKYLISKAGHTAARNIIESQIVYPRTANLAADKAILMLEFNGTLKSVVSDIENNIDLRAVDAVKDCLQVLKLVEEFKETILLDQADFFVIYKGGFDVLKLQNMKKPDSGRSIYIELNSARNELIRYTETLRAESFPYLIIGVTVLVMMVIGREYSKK